MILPEEVTVRQSHFYTAVFNPAKQWNHLEATYILTLGLQPSPKDSDVIQLGCGPSRGVSRAPLGNPNVQPSLRNLAMEQSFLEMKRANN